MQSSSVPYSHELLLSSLARLALGAQGRIGWGDEQDADADADADLEER